MNEVPAPAARPKPDITRDVILIGASLGGVQALRNLLSELPKNLKAAIAITLHRGVSVPELLSGVLGARSTLEVREAANGELFLPGRVYLAPADHHLLFGDSHILLNRGAREHHSRPSIDVMFRSGARNFGPRVIGVILTGNLTDGVAGLKAIKRHGGLSLVQEPAEAEAPSMPLNAIARDGVDVVFRLAAAGEVLTKLVGGKGVKAALESAGTRRPEDVALSSNA